ncbi:3-dehydroquinate synthase [candidate division KSB1 bacterium]
MNEITIDLGPRSYPVIIESGLLENTGRIIARFMKNNKIVIVTDENVADLYLAKLQKSLKAQDYITDHFIIKPGEYSKNITTINEALRHFVKNGLERNSAVVALGGGVVGDIAGFASSIYLRGIQYFQIPTTLLACCDSSVGGKTGINFEGTKNLAGTFHQPRAVLIDPDLLITLPDRELLSGLAEIIKTGLIRDRTLFDLSIKGLRDILSLSNMELVSTIISRSIAVKADVVCRDEREAGLRRILNFGHTIGHGMEAAAEGALLHGEAVLYGMAAAVWLSGEKGRLSPDEGLRITQALPLQLIPFDIHYLSFDKTVEFIRKDKKMVDNRIKFILLEAVGTAYESDRITEEDMASAYAAVQRLLNTKEG